jgi:hypothetical protein
MWFVELPKERNGGLIFNDRIQEFHHDSPSGNEQAMCAILQSFLFYNKY